MTGEVVGLHRRSVALGWDGEAWIVGVALSGDIDPLNRNRTRAFADLAAARAYADQLAADGGWPISEVPVDDARRVVMITGLGSLWLVDVEPATDDRRLAAHFRTRDEAIECANEISARHGWRVEFYQPKGSTK